MIDDADFDNELKQSNDLLIGLLFPTHGFMPPWSMIKFLFRIPKKKGVPVLCVAIRGYWINEIFNIIYLLPALLFSYWVFWYLIRLPAVNTIFTFTTFTHYYRRYHQPETKLKHIVRKKKIGYDE